MQRIHKIQGVGTGRPGRRAKLVAMATMAACAAAMSRTAARAQDVVPAAGAPTTQSQLPVRRFKIVGGQLAAALQQYRDQSGVAVTVDVPVAQFATFDTPGVTGLLSNEAALRQLLTGTGLNVKFNGPGAATIGVHDAQSVDVNDAVLAAPLQQFTEPLKDTAQTVLMVPQYIMQEQAVVNMRDALRNVPGISLAAGENGAQGDNLTIRGFAARNDIYLDGIRDFGSYYRDAFNYESIEVLEGPAGVEFGRGSTGGVVNQESKVPHPQEHVSGTLQLGTDALRRVTADVNEPIREVPGGTAFRMNLAGMQNNVAERDITNVSRFGIATSIAFGLNTPTRTTISYLHEGENDIPDYGLPYFGVRVAAVPRNTFYGYANDSVLKTNPDIVSGKVEHDFSKNFLIRNQLRWANYPRTWRIIEPQISSVPTYAITGVVAPTATAGTYQLVSGSVTATCAATATPATSCYATNTPLSQVQLKRNILNGTSTEDMLWDQASITGHVDVHGIGNNFVVLVEGGRERSRPQRATYPAVYTPVLNPNAYDLFPAPTLLGARTYVTSQSYGVGFVDTLKLRDWLLLSGGVRYDYFDTSAATAGTATLFHTDQMPNYRAAIVVKPRPAGSVYFDWGTSFNPSAESLSLSANNATQPPQTNETYETGVKWEFFHDRLNINAAAFQTTKDNVYETDPNNSNNVIPVGDQRVRGAQFGALGHMPHNFDIIVGYAYLDGRIIGSIQNYSPFASVSAYVNGATTAQTVKLYIQNDPVYGKSPFYAIAQGNPFANVPKNSANAFITHAIKWGFVGGFGFNQVSARRASSTAPSVAPNTNTTTAITAVPVQFKVIPGYITFNAMVRRPLNRRVDFQVNVSNLTNAFFIDQPHPSHLIPGEGINAQFGFNYKF